MIKKELTLGNLAGLRLSPNADTLSHLFFGYCSLKRCFMGKQSGLFVGFLKNTALSLVRLSMRQTKRKILVSKANALLQLIRSSLDYLLVREMGLYLGVPLVDGKPKARLASESQDSQESGWKSRCLSQAGRICRGNFSLAPMLYYTFAHSSVPQSFIQWTERLIRSFIWGHDVEVRGWH